jgi:branched-chain amino acid transport system ATP-binding protein
MLGAYSRRREGTSIPERLEKVFSLFPRLRERLGQAAGTLSGGEQQMLAIGRALMAEPRLLLLDEPSMGLAPILVKDIFTSLRRLNEEGLTMVLVEQDARIALSLAHRGAVMERGRIVLEDTAQTLLDDPEVRAIYFGRRSGRQERGTESA